MTACSIPCDRRPYRPASSHHIAAAHGLIEYNESAQWHDPDGHFFFLADERDPFNPPEPEEPLFFRARAGDVLELTFTNAIGFRKPKGPLHVHGPSGEHIPAPTEGQLEWMHYDFNIPPCDCLLVEGETRPAAECGLHVHIVKFDPISADGASVGWNYLSAPSDGQEARLSLVVRRGVRHHLLSRSPVRQHAAAPWAVWRADRRARAVPLPRPLARGSRERWWARRR